MDFDAETRLFMLRQAARGAEVAYAPYSRFRVGAAVLMDGALTVGCNVENASSGLTVCAERNAIFAGRAAGRQRLTAVAIAFPDLPSGGDLCLRTPCGACRQVMAEFGNDDVVVMTEGEPDTTLGILLPNAFRL